MMFSDCMILAGFCVLCVVGLIFILPSLIVIFGNIALGLKLLLGMVAGILLIVIGLEHEDTTGYLP